MSTPDIPRFCFNCGAAVIQGRRSCLRCNTHLAPDDMTSPPTAKVRERLPADALELGMNVAERYEIEAIDSVARLHVCYRAFDTRLGRPVTLRTLVGRERGQARRSELRRQARIQNALDHPHILRTLDFVEDKSLDVVAIVEEYVGARTLRTWLRQRGPTPLALELALYRQLMLPLASALAYAHRHGVVHRNLKPRKILLDQYDRVRITDFGLSAYKIPKPSKSFPALVGTLEYMAPEQADNPQSAEPAGDLYSLGVILYEIVCGELPIEGENDLTFLNNLLSKPPAPLVERAPDVPLGLDAVIMRCLEKIPVERHQSAHELFIALNEVLGGAAVT